jgi:hypothetical protein
MNKTFATLIIIGCIGLIGGYMYMESAEKPTQVLVQGSNPKNTTYSIDGELVTLIDGSA